MASRTAQKEWGSKTEGKNWNANIQAFCTHKNMLSHYANVQLKSRYKVYKSLPIQCKCFMQWEFQQSNTFQKHADNMLKFNRCIT